MALSSGGGEVASAVRGTVVACGARAATAQAAALSGVAASQAELAGQLDALEAEMARVAAVVDGLALDPAASGHMADARDSMARSRVRLVTVRGRLGRLRGFEESQRLVGVRRREVEMGEVGRGRKGGMSNEEGDGDGEEVVVRL